MLKGDKFVYLWADGIYVNVRSDQRRCLLVVVGCDVHGRKHFLAIEAGFSLARTTVNRASESPPGRWPTTWPGRSRCSPGRTRKCTGIAFRNDVTANSIVSHIRGTTVTARGGGAADTLVRHGRGSIRFRAGGGTVHAEDPGGIAPSAGRSDEEAGVVMSSRRGGRGWS